MERILVCLFACLSLSVFGQNNASTKNQFEINSEEYLEMRGANVMLAHDFYPESHQGGVGIIQNGIRVATNGDLRLEPTPGQWQPVPKVGKRIVDIKNQTISVKMQYPDESKKTGFNPIIYPDLDFTYTLKIKPFGKSFKIIVDLDKPLPAAWVGKVGMNIELFPGDLFGKSYYMDESFGIFNRQANGPGYNDSENEYQITPMASGNELVIVPENKSQTLRIKNLQSNDLQLIDGRAKHNNGWFVVRSLVPAGATKNAIEWLITPSVIKDFNYESIVQVSQVGYHPKQDKIAIIETDKTDTSTENIELYRVNNTGGLSEIKSVQPENWGDFLRYKYYQFDFSEIKDPGMYIIKYKNFTSNPFKISDQVFTRDVWQPTLEYFLPVQMCHMRVNDRYKVWHGRCHMDDARMAPINTNHFDGYLQGPSTLTKYKSGEHVPGINIGGWHDAGDYDLRVESQASTIQGLSHIYELFHVDYDNTSIDQDTRVVEIQAPDGKPDVLQQIEHGALSIVGGFKSMNRFYRGIIVPIKRQYVLLGDPVNHSDNTIFSNQASLNMAAIDSIENKAIEMGIEGAPDDRWVFTEENPKRSLNTAAALAASSRALKLFNTVLAQECLSIAEEIWNTTKNVDDTEKIMLAVELLQTTRDEKYSIFLSSQTKFIINHIDDYGWMVGPILPLMNDATFVENTRTAVKSYLVEIQNLEKETPYGVPYKPNIWGAGWGIQNFGVQQYFLHTSYPDIFPNTYMLNAMNFILGVHPGVNTSSFASGVGSKSLTQAYGVNRGEHSFIPGGIGSGTALIRPDFPELLEWPFLWQQTEYVLGGGTTDYMFLILAANQLLNTNSN
ncbi:glycoside hydrolase family 9 protein [Formosa sp. PL04]|uniref:glycoside hydrolase family 9 protein n=1 Tax=Formosa sp. PL04 TaxID=3081755 RepID=UPI00298255A6|nr:glycoside hydrolase family 9 protein [Formosa sp. PL04]MDW5287236.1 glycoside hydrolase family 9 protein [Formosa sp. PL04]